MRRYVILLIFMHSVLDAQVISYAELLKNAHENSHRLKLRSIDTSIEQSRLEGVYSGLYPQLSLGYGGEYSRNLDQASQGVTVGDTTINSAIPYKSSASVRLNYELYHFGTTLKQIDMQTKEIASRKAQQCDEQIKLDRDLLDTYADAHKMQTDFDYKNRLIDLHRELYHIKERLYTAGKESRVSIGDEAIRIIDLERDIRQSKMKFLDDLIKLQSLSYVTMDETVILSPLHENDRLSSPAPFEQTPSGRGYAEKSAQKQYEIDYTFRNQLPTVSLYSNYYLYGSSQENYPNAFDETKPNSWNAGISLRWILFEGFKYNSESQRLKLEKERIETEAMQAKRDYEHEILSHQKNHEHLSGLIHTSESGIRETSNNLTLTQRLRAQGEADSASEINLKLELLERELQLKLNTIKKAYEAEALKLYEGEKCTLH